MMRFAFLFIFVVLSAVLMGCSTGAVGTKLPSQTFSTTINNFDYSPGTITVSDGTAVTINIKNNDPVRHGVFLNNYGIQDFVNPGEMKRIQFTAKKGSFSTFCSTDHGEKLNIQVV